ncbi:MAG: hypothetical protein ACOY94_24905 [Bacillota bacterium]
MTFVIGSIQLTITRIQPVEDHERAQRSLEWELLEQRIAAARQETCRQMALNAYGFRG